MKLFQLAEDRFLERVLPHLTSNSSVVIGTGDDCAVVKQSKAEELLLLKTDCIVEGVHFTARTDAERVGWKAMARPLSDFAAMSGVPTFALVTLITPRTKTLAWATKLYRGLESAARIFDVVIVGGETSSTSGPAVVSVSLTGTVEKDRAVSRAGGKLNDDLFVTGRLGGSLRGKHLRFEPRIAESRWLTQQFRIHAMMDLSDGLGADLPRLARASKLGFLLDEASLPVNRGCTASQAISDGEDYELLFAVPASIRGDLERRWRKRWKLELTRIGRLTSRKSRTALAAGYVHFN